MLVSCRTTSARRARSKAGQLWCADNGPTQQTDREDKFIQNFHRKPFTSHQQPFYNKSNFVVLIRYVSSKKLLAPSYLPWCVRNRTRFGFVKAGHSVRAGWEFFFLLLVLYYWSFNVAATWAGSLFMFPPRVAETFCVDFIFDLKFLFLSSEWIWLKMLSLSVLIITFKYTLIPGLLKVLFPRVVVKLFVIYAFTMFSCCGR